MRGAEIILDTSPLHLRHHGSFRVYCDKAYIFQIIIILITSKLYVGIGFIVTILLNFQELS